MTKYTIFAITTKEEHERISPVLSNTNKEEMISIAKKMKYEMKDYYKKVELREDIYKYIESNFIEV